MRIQGLGIRAADVGFRVGVRDKGSGFAWILRFLVPGAHATWQGAWEQWVGDGPIKKCS